MVENHASVMVDTATLTTSTVLGLPHRALSAAVHAPGNLINLLKGNGKK